jgi:putative heme transporter
LLISIPIRGMNALYVVGAVAGIIIMVIAVVLVVGLIDGNGRSERAVRWLAIKVSPRCRSVGFGIDASSGCA